VSTNGVYPTLDDVRDILDRDGYHPILLPVSRGRKNPIKKEWNDITYEQTQEPGYQKELETCGNTGVVLGKCDDLCTIDCDTDAFMNRMLELNPGFVLTLTTMGRRAGQFWFYCPGDRPHKIEYLKVRKESPLAVGGKKVETDGTVKVGEFWAEGGQSIICGIHPDGPRYRWIDKSQPLTIDFSEIIWPEDIIITWEKDRKSKQSTTGSRKSDDLLVRAIAALSIDKLWEYFNYPARNGNPVCSPFREDRTPSFSVYDEGRRWRDHGNDEHGDSFDFYQRAKGQDSKSAFVGFIEMAGLGGELKGARYSTGTAAKASQNVPPPKAKPTIDELFQTLEIYFDPDRSCFWTKNSRGNWMKVSGGDVVRYLEELGYSSERGKGETCSETGLILNRIQKTMSVEYAASLAGYHKGLTEYRGNLLLIIDSPVLVDPAHGNWSILNELVLNMLGPKQALYFYGWLKIALEALRGGDFRPGQALVLAGPKNCGKSLLQNLLTILFGGRSAKPHQYMTGSTSFNGDLFCAEHLMIEDEQPATDIKSRRNFGVKIKEITANDTQRCHFKYRSGTTLRPFWRLTISLNDEPENLMILPPWDDSVEDKIILLKAEQSEMVMPTVTNEERAVFWSALLAALPALVYHLLNWEIPEDLIDHRYGVKAFHHPELLDALGALAPEARLMELIEAEIFKPVIPTGRPSDPWEGTSSALELRLTNDISPVRYQARALLSWPGACGTYLNRLQKLYPERITFHKTRKDRLWKIAP
jgi:hypothetical protein